MSPMSPQKSRSGGRNLTGPHSINHRGGGTAWYGFGTGLVHPETTIITNGYGVWYTGTPWRPYEGVPHPKPCVGSLCRSRHAAHAIRESAPFRGKRFFPMHSPLSLLTPVQPRSGNAFFALLAFRDNPSLTFRTFPPPIEPSRTFPNHKTFLRRSPGKNLNLGKPNQAY